MALKPGLPDHGKYHVLKPATGLLSALILAEAATAGIPDGV
jgi:hypothetical protein